MKGKSALLGLGIILPVALTVATLTVHNNYLSKRGVSASEFSLTLNSSNAYSSGDTKMISTYSGAYQVEFTYDSCVSLSNNHALINVGGSITNTQQITSISRFSVTYTGGSLRCQTSYDCSTWNEGFILASGQEYVMGSNPYFVKLTAENNNVSLSEAKYKYTCVANPNIPEPTPVVNEYQKVTSELTDYTGTYLIVYESGSVAFNGGLSTLDAINNTIDVEIANNTITSDATNDNATFEIAKIGNTNTYYVKSHSGYYIGRTSNDNGMLSSASTQYAHEISIDGSATLSTNLSGNNVSLKFNAASDQMRFRYYKSGQESIQLYKKVSSGSSIPTINEAVAIQVEDANKDTYTTNSIFANENALVVTAIKSDGTSEILANTDYSYTLLKAGMTSEPVDPNQKFGVEGTFSVTVTYGDLLPAKYSFEVGEYIYATAIYLSAPLTTFTTADIFADSLSELTADIEYNNPLYDSDSIAYSQFNANHLSVQLLNTGGAAYDLNQPFGTSGTWQIKLSYSYKGIELSTLVDITVNLIPVQSVTISDSTLTLEEGLTAQLTATTNPTNATNTNITWSSTDVSVATVSSTGLVTAIAKGTATIYATSTMDNTKVGQCVVTVTKPSVIVSEYLFTSKTWTATKDGIAANWTNGSSGNGFMNNGVQITTGTSGANATSPVSFTDVKKVVVSYCTNASSGAGSISIQIGSSSTISHTITKTGGTTARDLEFTPASNQTGNVKITVTCSTNSIYICGITITCDNNPVYPTSLNITGNSSVNVGDTTQLGVTFNSADVNRTNVTWTSNNTAVATVSNGGLVTGISQGSATITATGEAESGTGPTANITITVSNVAVSGVSINPTTLALTVGGSSTLTATVSPSNATNKGITFSSNNTSVATVDQNSGNVLAIAKGSATITATSKSDSSKKATCTVTVSDQLVTSISINPNSLSLEPGASSQLSAVVSPDNAANKSYTWSSSNTSVATVTSAGLVTAVTNGSANIYATANDGSNVKGTCAITVSESSSGSGTTDFDTWTLVSSINELSAGDVIVIADNTSEVVAGQLTTGSRSSYLNSESATFSGDEITELPSDAMKFTVGQSGSNYTFTNEDNELLGCSAEKKMTLGSGTTTWTLSISSGDVTMTSTTSNNGLLRYNSGSPRFTTYKSGQNAVQFYKGGVSTPVYPTSISINGTNEVGVGRKTQLSIDYTPSNTNQKNTVWTSDNSSVATVDQKGMVTGVSTGTTTINARETKENGSYIYASYTITVVAQALDSYTIMIYMCGSDLESDSGLATGDIKEILSVSNQPSGVNIIIETGGASSWYSTYGISKDNLERYHVANRQLIKDDTLSKADMSAQGTFESFLEWGLTEYPAQKTGVILWNHGGGMTGVCYDENYNGGYGTLTAAEVRSGVGNVFNNIGRTDKLEWIGYDACLMQVADIASVNADYFNYMIAAEESESGYGWDYDTFLPTLYNNPSTATSTILAKICDTFITSTGGSKSSNANTLSVLDLSKMDDFTTALEAFATSLNINSKTKWNSVKNVCNSTLQFGDNIFGNYDAVSLVDGLSSQFSVNKTALITAISNLVIYNKYGGYYSSTIPCGICLFVAYSSDTQYGLQETASVCYTAKDTKFSTWRSIMINYGF